MPPGRGRFPHRVFIAALLQLSACGQEEDSSGVPPCDTQRRAVFDSLPNGPPVEAEVDGVEVTGTCGDVEVARQDGSAVLLLVGDCVADEVHVVFDDPKGTLTLALLASRYGGEPFFTTTSSSLDTEPKEDGFEAGELARAEDDPRIARADVSGGVGGGAGASSVAIREVVFLAN